VTCVSKTVALRIGDFSRLNIQKGTFIMNENKRFTKLISTLASTTLLFLTALSTQAFIRQPSPQPPSASRSFVTEEEVTRTFPACKFLTKEDLQTQIGGAIKAYFPMLVRIHNPDGQFKFSSPTPIAAQCLNGQVTFKADGVFTRPGISMNRSITFTVSTHATVTYVPITTGRRLPVVKSATVCPTLIKVHDTEVMQGMKDAAQRQLDYNVRSQASCRNIAHLVYAYVQKGGSLL
jgi:hypothetical protein